LLSNGVLNSGVATRNRGGHCCRDLFGVLSNERPLGAAGNDEGNATCAQVLLVTDAPVGREKNIEAGLFCGLQKGAITERIPALGLCGVDGVPGSALINPLGVPWSKRMSTGWNRLSAETLRHEIEHCRDLLPCHVELLHDLVDAEVLEVLDELWPRADECL
jgi:hypothetical protein